MRQEPHIRRDLHHSLRHVPSAHQVQLGAPASVRAAAAPQSALPAQWVPTQGTPETLDEHDALPAQIWVLGVVEDPKVIPSVCVRRCAGSSCLCFSCGFMSHMLSLHFTRIAGCRMRCSCPSSSWVLRLGEGITTLQHDAGEVA